MIIKSRKSGRNVLNEAEKMTTAVIAPETTVSTITACQRLIFSPMACRVSPEEYRSMLLIANS